MSFWAVNGPNGLLGVNVPKHVEAEMFKEFVKSYPDLVAVLVLQKKSLFVTMRFVPLKMTTIHWLWSLVGKL